MNKDASQIIEEIGDIVKGVWSQSENPEGLSKSLNDIAVLNWALALWQSTFEEQERQMKAELDIDKATLMQEYVDSGDAVNKAEIKTTIKLGAKRKEYNKMASGLEKCKVMSRANQSVMDAARSRLSLIKEEIKR